MSTRPNLFMYFITVYAVHQKKPQTFRPLISHVLIPTRFYTCPALSLVPHISLQILKLFHYIFTFYSEHFLQLLVQMKTWFSSKAILLLQPSSGQSSLSHTLHTGPERKESVFLPSHWCFLISLLPFSLKIKQNKKTSTLISCEHSITPHLAVMVNFTSQLDWIMGYPDMWVKTIPGCVCGGG